MLKKRSLLGYLVQDMKARLYMIWEEGVQHGAILFGHCDPLLFLIAPLVLFIQPKSMRLIKPPHETHQVTQTLPSAFSTMASPAASFRLFLAPLETPSVKESALSDASASLFSLRRAASSRRTYGRREGTVNERWGLGGERGQAREEEGE